jgi:hypothetical protein
LSVRSFQLIALKEDFGMQTTLALREKAAQLLAADATTLAPATDANKMVLCKANFPETEQVVVGDITPADFDGSTPLLAGTGTQSEGLDPITNAARITIKSPVGGWRWETTGITNLPQTIYGVALMSNDLSVVLAVERFDTPIVLTAVNQVIDRGPYEIVQAPNSMT